MAEKFPILYAKTATTYSNYGSALLVEAQNLSITKRINSIPNLSFDLPPTSNVYSDLTTDAFIKVNDELFIIREIVQKRDNAGGVYDSVSCEGIISELIDTFVPAYEGVNVSVSTALTAILTGSRFSVGNVSAISTSNDLFIEDTTALEGLNKILENWSCEFVVSSTQDVNNKFPISLYATIGSNNSVQFRYAKNIKGITKTIDARDVITRLYPFGKDGLGIESVNSGVAYIDSVNISAYVTAKVGKIQYNEIDDATELKTKATTYLAKIDTPKITYEIDVVELKAVSGFLFESFELGDTVTIVDPDLASNVSARIVEYTYLPFENLKSKVTLSNFLTTAEDYLANLNKSKRFTDSIEYRGEVNTYWLNGHLNTLNNQVIASGAYTNAQVLSGKGILLENTNASSVDYGSVYLGPNIIAIANSKTAGNWNYTTFGTGAGFTANLINTGTLNAGLVSVQTESGNTTINSSGITSTRSDAGKTARVLINATDGIKIQKNIGTAVSPSWSNQFSVDGSGNAVFAGSLSAGISISSPSISGGSISGTTITGGTIQTSSSGSRIMLSSDTLQVYDTTGRRLQINPTSATTTSGASIDFQTSGSTVAALYTNGNTLYLSTLNSSNMDIRIEPNGLGYLYMPFAKVFNTTGGSLTSTFAAASHTHTKSQITDFAHTHTKSDITDFAHTHSWSDITSGKPTTRDGYGITDVYTKSEGDLRYAYSGSQTQGPSATATGGAHNHGIANLTKLAIWGTGNTVAGYVTWSEYAGFTVVSTTHTHTQY